MATYRRFGRSQPCPEDSDLISCVNESGTSDYPQRHRDTEAHRPLLLNVEHFSANPGSSRHDEQKPHPDEAQVRLDVNRSFINYPRGQDREALRRRLESLIVAVLRKHPTLSYFQVRLNLQRRVG